MPTIQKYLFLAVLLSIPGISFAQGYAEIRDAFPQAIETQVAIAHTFVYQNPVLSATVDGERRSNITGRFTQGRAVLAYRREGDFYAVATREQGHVGYILISALDVPQEEGLAQAPEVYLDYKSPKQARIMSLIFPGGGHLYTGDLKTGGALLGLGLGSVIVGYAASAATEEVICTDPELSSFDCKKEMDHTGILVGAGGFALAWAIGVLTAPGSARRYNERNGLVAQARIVPAFQSSGVRPALALRFRW